MTSHLWKAVPVCALLLCLGLTGSAAAEGAAVFDNLVGPYDQIRLALLHDTLDGVGEQTDKLQAAVAALSDEMTAAEAGVKADGLAAFKELLPELRAATDKLAAATEIKDVRDAFYEVSLPLVRYRAQLEDAGQVRVAYCPMARKSWLQPDGTLGNPYYGQAMAECGGFME